MAIPYRHTRRLAPHVVPTTRGMASNRRNLRRFHDKSLAAKKRASRVSISLRLVRRRSRMEALAVIVDRSIFTHERKTTMRVMVIVKATKDSEAGVMPSEELLTEMGKFNEELVKAGVLLAGDGLHPSSRGKRVRFSGGKKSVVDGPFAETKELVAGYWIWQVKSMDEAVEWVRRCPDPMPNQESEIEIRPVFEAEDFGAELTPELRAQEEHLRAEILRQHGS